MTIPTLETDRLTLTPLTVDDAPDLFDLFSNVKATRFMPFPRHADPDFTRHAIAQNLKNPGAIYWSVRLKGEQRVIGQINYLGGTRIPGLGYILHPDYWGQGITVEACRAALDYGFTDLGLDRVELWIDETNTASIRVAQKLGFGPKGRIPHKYAHETRHHYMLVWGMLVAQWHGEQNPEPSIPTQFFAVEPVLMVHDIEASAAFYRDKLGFTLDFLYGDPPNHAGVSRGEWTGSIVALQLSQVPPDREITPSSHLHIRVSTDLDELHATYAANGVEVIAPPENKPWGFREFTIKDDNGHILIFGTHS